MPIFQDHFVRHGLSRSPSPPEVCRARLPPTAEPPRRQASGESIRTELCEGPAPDDPAVDGQTKDDEQVSKDVFTRLDFVECLKRGEVPLWRPTRHLESLLDRVEDHTADRKVTSEESRSSLLLPAADIKGSLAYPPMDRETYSAGQAIERPRSALHSGDFTQETSTTRQGLPPQDCVDASSLFGPSHPHWLATSPPRDFTLFQQDLRFPSTSRPAYDSKPHSRALSRSSSVSSSFVFKAPTTPLVHSESNDELDFSSTMVPIEISASKRTPRRHTYQATEVLQSTPPPVTASSFHKPLPCIRRDVAYPYQAHQPRRSIPSNQYGPIETSPQSARCRRPSYTPDSSPLQLTSMVGSYEESILRGRMSTTPSKPLNFVAQIGVLGLGKCKPSLRCPAHVTIPFPAVFYRYGTTTHGRTGRDEEGPSPYVGQIDLESSLLEEESDMRRKRYTKSENSIPRYSEMLDSVATARFPECEVRRAQKQKRRSASPKAPPGGSYRIPEKGQLQIIIKNPHKTAVKLFLVPYDLAGMEAGTKTFIRQRSYSGGPILDVPTPHVSEASDDRPTLRYLIHLQICSPARGRFFLYKSIRVVFANRVPDGKEKLRNEISLPEPRFSVYKPGRDSTLSAGAGTALAAEKAFRRRSSGYPPAPSQRACEPMSGVVQSFYTDVSGGQTFANAKSSTTPVEPIPFSLYRHVPMMRQDDGDDDDDDDGERSSNFQSPTSSKSSRPPTSQNSGLGGSWNSSSTGAGTYDKLNKGDIGYGGSAFAGSHHGQRAVAGGLLALKLKSLGVGTLCHGHPSSAGA